LRDPCFHNREAYHHFPLPARFLSFLPLRSAPSSRPLPDALGCAIILCSAHRAFLSEAT
jgi:hypothetical protein